MALRKWTRVNGVVSGSSSNFYFGGYEWQVINSDADRIANNRSILRVRQFAGRTSTSYSTFNLNNNTSWFKLDNQANQNITTRFDFRNATANVRYYVGTDTNIFPMGQEMEFIIPHNTDGTKEIRMRTYLHGGLASFSGVDTDATFNLPAIPRASSVTATNADIGSATSININRASSSFKHTLKYSCGGQNGTIATNVDTSFGWTVPTSFYALIPNSKSILMLLINCFRLNLSA